MADDQSINAVCEACGEESQHPWNRRGRIGECPHCLESLDIPDPSAFVACEEPPCDFPEDSETGVSFLFADGFPHPIWDETTQRAGRVPPSQLRSFWVRAASVWLHNVCRILPAHYHIHSTRHFLILSALQADEAADVGRRCEEYYAAIHKQFSECQLSNDHGPEVLLCFEDFETYFTYISHTYPEGEFGGSGGMCLLQGYGHIAVPHNRSAWQRTLAHELTHLLFSGYSLPPWLNEGLAQLEEELLTGHSRFQVTPQSMREQRAFWNEHTVREFLTGEAFSRADDGMSHAYQLSEMLVRNLISQDARRMKRLLQSVSLEDHGDGALRECFGQSLEERLEQLLGDGKWKRGLSTAAGGR